MLGDLLVQSASLSFASSTSLSSFSSFSLTFLADPHHLTPMESNSYGNHREGAPSLEFTLRESTPVTSLESPLVDVFILIDLKGDLDVDTVNGMSQNEAP